MMPRSTKNSQSQSKKEITTLPLLSSKLSNSIQNNIIGPALAGTHVTITTFKKAGLPFGIHTTYQNLYETNKLSKKSLFVWINLETEQTPNDLMFDILLNIKRNHFSDLQPHVVEVLSTIISKTTISEGEFRGFIDFLVYDEKFKIVFILKDFDALQHGDLPLTDASTKLFNFIEALILHCTQYSGFIFISSSKLESVLSNASKPVWGFYKSNMLNGKDFSYDDESLELSAEHFQFQNKIKFEAKFIDKLKHFSHGDPTVVLYSFYQALVDSKFVTKLSQATDESGYQSFGSGYLDWRYGLITSKMDNIDLALIRKDPFSINYLLDTGLLSKKSNKGIYINPLFAHYIKEFSTPISQVKPQNEASSVELRGQEILLFNLLTTKQGEIVSKDTIAEAIWGQEWEQKYSDWAIDKLVSTVKKKLVETSQPYKLQTFKKLGVMLVPVDSTPQPALPTPKEPGNPVDD